MRNIEEIKEEHAERLMALPGVVMVGIGRDEDGRPAIIIGLDGEHPGTRQALPPEIEGYPTVIREVGTPRIQSS
jgi:hypothetical protein